MYRLVIAEKPVLARDIARALCSCPVSDTTPLPIKGNGYTVIACAGHLLELVEPETIDQAFADRYNEACLPISINNWPKVPIEGKESLVNQIKELLADASLVINAGDPDDEGQLIVDEVLDYLDFQGQVKRVFVNDNIEENIRKAFDNLVDNDNCKATGKAAYARQMADKCFGINESRLASIRLRIPVSVGRVQTPTLGLIVSRDEAIEDHKSRLFYELYATGTCRGHKLTFKFRPEKKLLDGEKHIFDKDILDGIKTALEKACKEDISFETVVEKKSSEPPLPYNLTELQSDMSKRFGFSLEYTQEITQSLRDKYKAITYNRTDSQYLKEEHFEQASYVLTTALANIDEHYPLDYSLHSRAFNDKGVDAHHAIIPQDIELDITVMSEDEQKVYTSIIRRYAVQFLPAEISLVSTSTFAVDDGVFEHKATRVLDRGWKFYLADNVVDAGGWRQYWDQREREQYLKDKNEDDEEDVCLEEGDYLLKGVTCSVKEKKTTPPRRYTEGTLVKDMSSIAKYVVDANIKQILKDKDADKKGESGGIGTTATRAAIVEKLKSRKFIEEKNGKLISTPKGRTFYHALPNEIKKADTTARWWLIQQEIMQGREDVNAIQRSVVEVFNTHRESAYVGVSLTTPLVEVGTCPRCGAVLHAHKNSFQCSTNTFDKVDHHLVSGCGYFLNRTIAAKKLSDSQAKTLFTKGKSALIKGFKSKKGNTFSAYLVLTDSGECRFKFPQSANCTKRKDHVRKGSRYSA